jgi:SAM-dependent methyltransferase
VSRFATSSAAHAGRFDPPRARRFYDRFGARQDRQGWYEDAALDRLIERSSCGTARRVVELGCGTGRLAALLLATRLPGDATYRAFDLSSTMVALTRERIRPYSERATVELSSGEPPLEVADGEADRFVSTYVLDLLGGDLIARTLDDAHRVLAPAGLLCLAGIAPGIDRRSRLVMGLWGVVRRIRPSLVGGCRPLALEQRLDRERWEIVHDERLTAYGIASQILVAVRR